MNDELYIRRCLELAEKGLGKVQPNPVVGAVLVYNERIIGEGWHKQYGHEHAEVNCLNAVKEEDKELIAHSTMYVSLEPCAHYGKTPPCAERLVKEKVKRVVICNKDPHDKVAGKGIKILEDAGIQVNVGLLNSEGDWINRRFFSHIRNKRPYIILKWAETSDGFIAPSDKSRFQISNKESKTLVHKWRAEEQAILVGNTTALNDDPELTTREWKGSSPLRIVIDRKQKLPQSLKVFEGEETWILNDSLNNEDSGNRYVKLDFSVSIIPQLLEKLYEHNIQSIIVEGGSETLKRFIAEGAWDEARIFSSDSCLGNGVKSPSLGDAHKIEEHKLSTDILSVFVRDTQTIKWSE